MSRRDARPTQARISPGGASMTNIRPDPRRLAGIGMGILPALPMEEHL
jgi:hypothetical protein